MPSKEACWGEPVARVDYQTLLTGDVAEVPHNKGKDNKRALDQEDRDDENEETHAEGSSTPLSSVQQQQKKLLSHEVRTSLQDRPLDSMFAVVSFSQQASGGSGPSGAETPPHQVTKARDNVDTELSEEEKAEDRSVQWQRQHVLFPALARYLVAPKSLLDGNVVQVASLPDLYRVFETC
ncbi:uncharacterized protein LAESUDRAFT_761687 [Laetiporus sulphureus 93-53]|uniref:DNA mismatch repair protein Mlh1 C-terminal domain-containing protein n=1 Tax=Laetiporus sulphureus 93-53 TaxID=1314785 RepID=A0A165CZW5_9APHY|nr:uncharacterized protein LAESUDRAFT_761687 [Laetiporus sulphureus 93-53]KZT03851.1 hypothetical protein LAESUDRAFT_761687 [Laetiporus sulphureus 93-53]